ncbi:MAG: hypothetical protein EOO81_07945 [Oxalobacteraceae bacterium]|nr:MAG: hypothetical protein EOO81_07945 [Oxalobacteraceae bacterium]
MKTVAMIDAGALGILYVHTARIMLVRALRLRHLGLKLPPHKLRAELPLLGNLRLADSSYAGRDGRGKQVCLLMPLTRAEGPYVELFNARLIRIEARGVLIGGTEEVWLRKKCTSYPQVLWAWPIDPDKLERDPGAA